MSLAMSELHRHSIATLSTETKPKPPEETERRTSQEPPYKVILHNDDFTPMEYVVETLIKVIPRMSEKQAISIMIEAHTNDKAVAHKTHKELAELYAEQLTSKGLIASIEPD